MAFEMVNDAGHASLILDKVECAEDRMEMSPARHAL